MSERLLVIGGDAAGMSAAAQARRLRGPDDLEIVAFERGLFTSYAACGIPFFVGGLVEDASQLVARSPEQHRERGLDVRTETEVIAIDVDRRVVRARDLVSGAESDEPFDRLVIATGATPIRPPLPGVDAGGIFGVQTLTDGLVLRHALEAHRSATAVVVGGGYIGLEIAEALRVRDIDVTLVDQASQPMLTLDPDMAALVTDALRHVGVQVHLDTQVEGFVTRDGHVRAVATSAGELSADLVVLGIGVRPNSALALDAGIAVGATGGVVTDRRMQTSVEGVFAAGDCVETYHRVSRRSVAIALGTHANKQGTVAGANAAGGYATFPGVIGTAVTKICAYEVARTGLKESEAVAAGFECVTAAVDASTRAHYYPDAQPIRVKLVAERVTGRLLGGQIVGREGAAKRIDVLATAIWNEMTVGDVAMLDLSYAPPFSPVWDPVQQAGRQAANAVRSAG